MLPLFSDVLTTNSIECKSIFALAKEIAMPVSSISPKQLLEEIRSGKKINLIDVRTPVEYREVHVSGAKNVPLDRISSSTHPEIPDDAGAPTYVVCKSGGRSKQACDRLTAGGYKNIVNVEGGTSACEQAGLPVVRGKKAMSLERQVRIAAGTLVLTGVLLGAFVSEWFLILPGFVGAGLVFAGVTDTCGMGMILARMPWNQVSSGAASSAAGS
jgi:rhodanese-related sulfurtransferase